MANIVLYEENPNQMHQRLAGEVARIESKYKNPLSKDEIYDLFKDFKYSPLRGYLPVKQAAQKPLHFSAPAAFSILSRER